VIDVARARADTPGVEGLAHLNNAGAALPPQPVLDAVIDHLRREAEIGGYEAADERGDSVEHTYDAIARLIGARRDEIAIVENATRAWDMAFYALELREGDRVLTTNAEYASNYIPMRQVADRTGAAVVVVPDDEHGQVDVERLAAMLDERVKLVSLVHVPSQGGLVQPAAAVGAACRAAGVPLLLDACQSIGQMPVDVEEIGCDMLSATGRKFLRGPRGTGFLYVRRCSTSTPPSGSPTAPTRSAPTPAASRTGRRTWRPRSGSASRPTTRSPSGSRRSATACARWPATCASAWPRSRA
jgi:cysteine desulfurase/selenocysteine lyase